MSSKITEIYTNRVRIRACGLCWAGERLLLVNHQGLTSGNFWCPPGGGVKFGETVEETLIREFWEETGITIRAQQFQFVCEYIQPPLSSGQATLHAVELFFSVEHLNGDIRTGIDPEHDARNQLITDVRYRTFEEILAVPVPERHGIFTFAKSAADLKGLTGFYRI